MDKKQLRLSELANIDEETQRWLLDFTTWKRRRSGRPGDVHIAFLLQYMAKHLYDYYFIQRNYSHLVPMLRAYADEFGNVEGLTRLIEDLRTVLTED
jgi:hypothetical protein